MRILIEPAALMHVIGTTMDFVTDRIKCALPRLVTGREERKGERVVQRGHGVQAVRSEGLSSLRQFWQGSAGLVVLMQLKWS